MKTMVTSLVALAVLVGIGSAVYLSSDGGGSANATGRADAALDAADRGGAIVLTDDRGRAFTFDLPPKRIAACSAFAVEILMAMDHPPVARFEDPDLYPLDAEPIPVIARSHSVGPDVEQLIAQDPDLIVLHEVYGGFADAVEKSVGVPVMVMNIKSVDQVREKLVLFGVLTGNTDVADQLVADLDRTRSWLDEHLPVSPGERPLALSLLGTDDAWYAHRENHFMGALLQAVGAENAAAGDPADAKYRSLTPVDLEQVIVKDPDVIFLVPYGDANTGQVVQHFSEHPATRSLRAVREGRVHVLEDTIYTSQPGPRSGLALRKLHAYLYPDREQPGW